ncbi:hypothetical protein LXL04_034705 [Taraxacum kok-saghyz]
MRFILFTQTETIPRFLYLSPQIKSHYFVIKQWNPNRFFYIHMHHSHDLNFFQVSSSNPCSFVRLFHVHVMRLIMNEQHISKTPELPVKRKRGRPRKDETTPRPHPPPPPPPVAPAPPPPTTIHPPPPPPIVLPPVDHSMVGQAVTCIIDGVFDNGYLISTRLGPNNAILRGIVFQQGHVAPVTPENDVAPHLHMCTRTEFPIPPANPRNPEAVAVQNYQNAPPQGESLRLVEQDDVMQVFEVSKECDRRPETEGFVGKDSVIPEDMTGMESEQHRNQQDLTGMESEPVKEPEEVTENQESLMPKDEQTKEQTAGEENNIDANQAVAVDLSLSNFSEI